MGSKVPHNPRVMEKLQSLGLIERKVGVVYAGCHDLCDQPIRTSCLKGVH